MRLELKALKEIPTLQHFRQMVVSTHPVDMAIGTVLVVLAMVAMGIALWQVVLLTETLFLVPVNYAAWLVCAFGPLIATARVRLRGHELLHARAAKWVGVATGSIKVLPESVRLPLPKRLRDRLIIGLASAAIYLGVFLLTGIVACFLAGYLWGETFIGLVAATWAFWALVTSLVSVHDLGSALWEISRKWEVQRRL